jgi:hypothetical protein
MSNPTEKGEILELEVIRLLRSTKLWVQHTG